MSATVSLLYEPDYLEPVNAEMWYGLTSASASVVDEFTYVIDVWKLNQFSGNTQSKLGRFKFPPRPSDYYGVFSVNKALKSEISNVGPTVIDPDISTPVLISDLYVRYQIYYGFEYNPNITYYDFVNTPSFGIALQSNPNLLVGDYININKTNNTVNSQYNGVHIVGTFSSGTVSIPGLTFGAYFVGLDGSFGVSTPVGTDGGIIDNLLRVSGTSSKRLGFHGTRQYEEAYKDFGTDYLMTLTSSNSKFLTNYSGYKNIKPYEYETENLMYEVTSPTFSYILNTYDSNSTLIGTYTHSFVLSVNRKYYSFPTGTRNLVTTFATASLFNGVYSYDLSIYESGGSRLSELLSRKIDYTCSLYEDVRIVFLNRMGGYDYWTFNKDNKRTANITRTEYKKVLPALYTIGERGQTTLSQNIEYTYSLNSDWVTEYEYSFLEELVTSPNVFIVKSDATLIPINITDTSYQIKTQLRDKLFNMTINYKLSNSINIQNQ